MPFNLQAPFKPSGDQPEAISQLVKGLQQGLENQTLLGVTGSGKTFTIANVLQKMNRPTLVMSHNKTLAAQLYSEFKEFFPDNAVEYFVSYYDYYQPEAYLPTTNTYIEKDLSINEELEKLRLSTTSALLSGRRDIIVVSSVSCIYGIGNPEEFAKNTINLTCGQKISRNKLLHDFVGSLYSRTEVYLERAKFRVKGDIVDIFPAYSDIAYRITFWGDEIESMESIDPIKGFSIELINELTIYPANIFVTSQDTIHQAIKEIQIDLKVQVDYFKEIGKHLEAKRLEDRVNYDIEMIKELGYCSGIENYSRYFDKRKPGTRPFCLIDYFPDDFILIIDESHVSIPQIKGMYEGDRSRKINLVEYGFRLPAALDNRPLRFEEFQSIIGQTIYISATPADFELEMSQGAIVEQVVRPTGLLDPIIEIRPCLNQIDDLLEEINKIVQNKERVLVTTLTKRMAEELSRYLQRIDIKTQYIHSDVDTLERIEILDNLREGAIDVLIGVNLLREGLDLPEVSLVAILDADKEGFLRSERSLTQTAGRAARNVNGKVIFYADKITQSMQKTMDETNRRREKQIAYNLKNNIYPQSIQRTRLSLKGESQQKKYEDNGNKNNQLVAEENHINYLSPKEINNLILSKQKAMEKAVKELNFMEAARLRDEINFLKNLRD
ncbi:MAG: excinuclease ABC subunit UvrB [Bacteroidales bacterium]|jgi:excinuclease ABC subunit B|nr:excinuclease ABC subunit UvrB [Bacteroidales bacterium]MDD3331080.1 excinuclease ABC subunit UvrB [Bacteroidales bacterium]MDD3691094.1 excinuclease ABC subunit UvrB [Bacteroidales bacterium]MDD4044547.1 excinuclease ABC subunit UvrB [Bacteroidales bacterium]MDD4580889.1 excinuclease ABC subunit UvrB [Bacteroidales bacterium]